MYKIIHILLCFKKKKKNMAYGLTVLQLTTLKILQYVKVTVNGCI